MSPVPELPFPGAGLRGRLLVELLDVRLEPSRRGSGGPGEKARRAVTRALEGRSLRESPRQNALVAPRVSAFYTPCAAARSVP